MAIPDMRSYNGMLYSLGLLLQDVVRCRVTAPTDADTFTSDDLKYGEDDELKDSEIWFEETTGMGALRNPFLVTSNVAASGTVNLNKAYGASGPVATTLFTLGNLRAEGFPHQQKLDALLMAMADAGQFTRSSALLTLDTTNYHHTIPAGLWTITGVVYTDSSGRPVSLPPSALANAVNRFDRTLYLPYDVSAGQTVRAYGRAIFSPPVMETLDYAAVVTQRPSDIVRAAAGWLRSGQIGRAEQANAAALLSLSMRRLRSTLGPNEIMIGEA